MSAGFDAYDKTPPIATHQARGVVVTKPIKGCVHYVSKSGGWTTSPDEAKRFHNFTTALQTQRALAPHNGDATLIR